MNEQPVNPAPYTPVRFDWPLPLFPAHAVLASIGSCFSESIAAALLAGGLHGAQNPNGILYNPVSICEAIHMLDVGYFPSDLFEYNGLWHSWMHHGAFSGPEPEAVLSAMETSRKTFFKAVRKCDVFLMTVSSAVVYRRIVDRRIVANCHKVPGNQFERQLLSADSCRAAILETCKKIREWNPDCGIVLTLSPVRHMPGELTLNSLSKARLLDALRETARRIPNCAYFPAYEIMMDELRDYRWFADDMLHPSELAKRIILERFLDTCFVPKARHDWENAERLARQNAHIPIHPAE